MRRSLYIIALCLGLLANPFGREIRLYFTGDIMLDRNVLIWQQNHGFLYPVYDILPTLWEADMLSGNLESIISDKGEPMDKYYIFRAPPEQMELLKICGFDLVSVANNHALDYDFSAFVDNMERLDQAGIFHTGGGENLNQALSEDLIQLEGLSIGFLGINDTRTNFLSTSKPCTVPAWDGNERMILNRVARLDTLVDIVVVHAHWGHEDTTFQSERQEVLGRLLIEWGADIVVGHHPHRLQPVEFYRDGILVYSLGNFIFDQNDTLNMVGGILDVRIKGGQITDVNMIPVENINPPRAVSTVDSLTSEFVLHQMKRILSRNGVIPIWIGDRFRLHKPQPSDST